MYKIVFLLGFEQENAKYQELIEKFEHQSRLKDEEFKRVKDAIKLKFTDNEKVISDLKLQLKNEKE